MMSSIKFEKWLKHEGFKYYESIVSIRLEADSHEPHELFIGVVDRNGVCHQYWNPTEEEIKEIFHEKYINVN